ncbi:MAG: penicillin-binding protein 2, partial [Phycisphaeraceae bacterium]
DGRKFKRTPIWWREELSKAEHDGGHVVLTIDSVIQRFAQSHLSAAVEAFEAESGVALVLAPRTGSVLAIAQYPTFDPNRYQDAPAARRRNRAICDVTEPGSTFKPYVACAALLAGVVDPDEKIFCHNGQHYFGRRLMHDTHPNGMLDFEGILTHSSNIGMGILGERMGNEVIHKMVRAFGFGGRLGVKFPGEAPGVVRPIEQWTRYSTTSVPIGQEIAVTPLQLISAFCAIVNGGNLMRPRLVQALLDAKGTVVVSFDQPEVIRRVLPRDLANYMATEVLVGVVKNGGARWSAPAGWQMAGKTGTAQIPFKDRAGYEPGAYTGSFMGAAPAHDPRCAVLVMIHRPNPVIGYYGSKVAAPAAGKIMADTLAYLQVPPTHGPGRLAAVRVRPKSPLPYGRGSEKTGSASVLGRTLSGYLRDMGERAIRIGDQG